MAKNRIAIIAIAALVGAIVGISPMRAARAACDSEAQVRAEYPGADMEYLRRPGRNCWYARKRQGRTGGDAVHRESSWPGREAPDVWPDLGASSESFKQRWAPVTPQVK